MIQRHGVLLRQALCGLHDRARESGTLGLKPCKFADALRGPERAALPRRPRTQRLKPILYWDCVSARLEVVPFPVFFSRGSIVPTGRGSRKASADPPVKLAGYFRASLRDALSIACATRHPGVCGAPPFENHEGWGSRFRGPNKETTKDGPAPGFYDSDFFGGGGSPLIQSHAILFRRALCGLLDRTRESGT